MKKRFVTSIIAAGVYTGIYAGILAWQEQEIKEVDLIVGAVVFAITFYVMRSWLDKRRFKKGASARSEDV